MTRSRRAASVTGAPGLDEERPAKLQAPEVPCWMSLHTLAGKELPLPGVGPGDSVGDAMAACAKRYGCPAGGGKGEAGLYWRGAKLLDPAVPLRSLGLALPPKRASLVLQNGCYEDLCRQASVVGGVVDAFLAAHYTTLSSSVHAIGQVSGEFYALKTKVQGLRRQVDDTRQLLTGGTQEQPVRELYEKKREYTHVLRLLETLRTVRDAPGAIDALLERRCFVGAVNHFTEVRARARRPRAHGVSGSSEKRWCARENAYYTTHTPLYTPCDLHNNKKRGRLFFFFVLCR
jgi:hypothetical protein